MDQNYSPLPSDERKALTTNPVELAQLMVRALWALVRRLAPPKSTLQVVRIPRDTAQGTIIAQVHTAEAWNTLLTCIESGIVWVYFGPMGPCPDDNFPHPDLFLHPTYGPQLVTCSERKGVITFVVPKDSPTPAYGTVHVQRY